jgi:hypothetical protein
MLGTHHQIDAANQVAADLRGVGVDLVRLGADPAKQADDLPALAWGQLAAARAELRPWRRWRLAEPAGDGAPIDVREAGDLGEKGLP